jgi:HEPN domain-containing protein
MENLKEQLEDLYSQIYSVCDEEGSDDVLCLLDDVCAQYEVEDIASCYFNDEQLTEEEATRLLEVFEIVLDEIS